MQAGRVLQKDLRHKESFIIANGFLEGTDGRKMSKSWGNGIWLTDPPNDMYGKIMSLRDELIVQYCTLATNMTMKDVHTVEKRLLDGENPMVLKKELAHHMVSELHCSAAATNAQQEFETRFQKGKVADADLPIVSLNSLKTASAAPDVLVSFGLTSSKSEAKRLVEQKAVRVSGIVVVGSKDPLVLKKGDTIEVGRKAVRIES